MAVGVVINILLIVINAFFAIAKKKDNKVIIYISFLSLFLLMAGFRGSYSPLGLSHDMYNYMRNYNIIQSGRIFDAFQEPGYRLLVIFFSRVLKVDFLFFYECMHAICLVIIFYMLKRFCKNSHVAISLFSCLFLIYCCEQFQHYISLVVVMYGLCDLITSKKEGINYRYVIIILIATMIHYTSIFYIIFLLINLKDKKLLIKIVTSVTLILILLQIITNNRFNLNTIISWGIFGDSLNRYNTSTKFGYLYGVCIQVSGILLSYFNKKAFVKNQNSIKKEDNYTYNFTDKVLWLNILAIILIPVYMINTQAIRLARGLLLLDFLSCSVVLPTLKLKKRFCYICIYLIWIILIMLMIMLLLSNVWDSVVVPFYQKNIFFN